MTKLFLLLSLYHAIISVFCWAYFIPHGRKKFTRERTRNAWNILESDRLEDKVEKLCAWRKQLTDLAIKLDKELFELKLITPSGSALYEVINTSRTICNHILVESKVN